MGKIVNNSGECYGLDSNALPTFTLDHPKYTSTMLPLHQPSTVHKVLINYVMLGL